MIGVVVVMMVGDSFIGAGSSKNVCLDFGENGRESGEMRRDFVKSRDFCRKMKTERNTEREKREIYFILFLNKFLCSFF
jgi:hypothetical protein